MLVTYHNVLCRRWKLIRCGWYHNFFRCCYLCFKLCCVVCIQWWPDLKRKTSMRLKTVLDRKSILLVKVKAF